MENYYLGNHPLPFLTESHQSKMIDEFRRLLEESRSNFMRLVVDVVEERLQVEGIRLSAGDDSADEASWRTWQANQLDAESQVAFSEALVKGVSYLSVWDEGPGGSASIAVEDAAQTIVAYAPGSPNERVAALKVWRDEWAGLERANVYLPDGIYKFQRKSQTVEEPGTQQSISNSQDSRALRWEELSREFVRNPYGVVPIVPLKNRPRLRCEGESEIADVVAVQNQINGFLFLLALAGYVSAHKQRWATGLAIMEKDGKLVEPFNAAADRLWVSTDKETTFGEFSESSLDGYLKAIDQKIQHIATTTRTPRHYLEQEGQSPSGDALESAESGLVKKVEKKQRTFGEGLEEALRLAATIEGRDAKDMTSEIVWADPRVRTEAQVVDANVKLWQAKMISWRQACENIGMTQSQIDRMLADFDGTPPEATGNQTPPGVPAAA